MPCCLTASEDDCRADPEAFPCFRNESCPVADELAALEDDPENAAAWRIFHQITCRFTADLHTGALALERLTADMDAESFTDLYERLRVLYDILCPVPEPKADF